MKEKAAVALIGLGLLQMSGDVLDVTALRGLGMATGASPAPRVFSSLRGMEVYSTRFFIEWHGRDGALRSLPLTPETYERVRGAYNRRNAYGAALAAGPVLDTDPLLRPMFRAVLVHGLCGEARVLRELGIDPADIVGPPWIRYEPVAAAPMPDLPRVVEAGCQVRT